MKAHSGTRKPLHFRRCHICGSVNHRRGTTVEKCLACGKPLARFFFFDEFKAARDGEGRKDLMDGAVLASGFGTQKALLDMPGERFGFDGSHPRKPLVGFSAAW